MGFLIDWLKRHIVPIVVGLVLCWMSIGINYAVFLKPQVKVADGGKYIEAPQGYSPLIAVSAGDYLFGCAHLRVRGQKK